MRVTIYPLSRIRPSVSPPPPPTRRGVNGNPARSRRATGSSEPINDPALVVGSTSRVVDSVPAMQTPSASQGASQDSQAFIEDIFADINHVQGDFVHRQNSTLLKTYIRVDLYIRRDC
jgi:hypothetical protein